MKTKPILIIAAIVVVVVSAFFLFHKKKAAPNSVEITEFLYKFNNAVNERNADTVMKCFQFSKKNKALKNLANLLIGKKGEDGSKPRTAIALDIDKAETKNIGAGLVSVKIPVTFSHRPLDENHSVLILKIYKTAHYKLKIIEADMRKFLTDYTDYETYVKSNMHIDDVAYSPLTLASFKTADQLKTRYDSVVWFEHVDGKTYYYVIKGKLDRDFYWSYLQKDKGASNYKMGLVNPDLKEIIPPEYDLVHNVGGTIDGFVEVEMGDKKGLYNLEGKNVVVVIYDQIIPLNDDNNLALLRKDDNYFYLKKDTTVTDKLDGFKIADELPKFKNYASSYKVTDATFKNLMEYNERGNLMSLVLPPSYLVDLQLYPKFMDLSNPLRKGNSDDPEVTKMFMKVQYDGEDKSDKNWFSGIFYSIISNFWQGRDGFYETGKAQTVLVVDKNKNRILGFDAEGFSEIGRETGTPPITQCNENHLRALNDTLFEYKGTSYMGYRLSNQSSTLDETPYYYYLHIVNGKLAALPSTRIFSCTKYVKMDDSYLDGCFVINDRKQAHISTETLEYMKNEIYASYGYKFKSDKWTKVFADRFQRYNGAINTTVDDSLTDIEKYNISWINNKLKTLNQSTLAAQ